MGMSRALRENGKKAVAYLHEPLPKTYALFSDGPIITEDLPDFSNFATILCLDFSAPGRFKEGIEFHTFPSINVDHHIDNQNFCADNFVFPDAAATAEIVFHTLLGMGDWKISSETATCLLLGLIMDTGCFRFANTGSAALRTAAEMMDFGADHAKIMDAMFLSKPFGVAKMEAEVVLKSLRTAFDGRFAWFHLSDELLDRHGVDLKETERLIDVIREIEGFEIVAIVKDADEKGKFRLSLRSKNPKFPVGPVARRLGGGGHELAAGCSIDAETIETAEEKMLAEIAKAFSKGN
jgi:phosphoesterase RecJ-like protein